MCANAPAGALVLVRKSPTIHSLYKSTVFLKILQLLGVDNSIYILSLKSFHLRTAFPIVVPAKGLSWLTMTRPRQLTINTRPTFTAILSDTKVKLHFPVDLQLALKTSLVGNWNFLEAFIRIVCITYVDGAIQYKRMTIYT